MINTDFCLKVLENAQELVEEAEILYAHGRLKRPMFFLITAHEELEKITSVLNGSDSRKTFNHNYKFKSLNQAVEVVAKYFEREETFLKIKNTLIEHVEKKFEIPEEIRQSIYDQIDENFRDIPDSIRETNFMHIRGSCLYIDENQKVKYETELELKHLRDMYLSWLSSTKKQIESLRHKIKTEIPI